eukprot:4877412-Pleurochrysis_carterae.AAC.1
MATWGALFTLSVRQTHSTNQQAQVQPHMHVSMRTNSRSFFLSSTLSTPLCALRVPYHTRYVPPSRALPISPPRARRASADPRHRGAVLRRLGGRLRHAKVRARVAR